MLTNKKGLDFVRFIWKANSCQHDSPYSCHLVFFLEKEASNFFLACACEAYWIDTDVPRDFTAVTDLLYLMVPYFDPLFDLGVEDLSGSYRQLEKFAYILCCGYQWSHGIRQDDECWGENIYCFTMLIGWKNGIEVVQQKTYIDLQMNVEGDE